jgi:tetratricopeptide (TPR) repeat protein
LTVLRSRAASWQEKTSAAPRAAAQSGQTEAFRLNTLGVAYMNQQKFAEAQKYFEKALAADPKFAIARLNLGISLLSQQKLERARAALEEATRLLPNDPYAWYNLGLIYKDTGENEKGIDAFQHVAQLSPEADAHYFLGYLFTQLQRYDEAIAEFQKAIAAFAYHASSEFGIARAYQRKGDVDSARQHLARFQKITTEHLGSPFGAGYGDQGRFSLAELGRSGVLEAPAAIAVSYKEQPIVSAASGDRSKTPGPSTGACFIDYDGDGKPDLFLVSALNDRTSRLLHTRKRIRPQRSMR